jgi:hypothetical protein
MDEVFNWFRRHVHGEIAVVTGAPMLFGMAVLVVGAMLFFMIRAHFSQQIRALEATIGHKQSLLDEYKDKLQGATPLEVQQKIAGLEEQIAALDRRVNRPHRRLAMQASSEIGRMVRECIFSADPAAQFWVIINSSPDTDSSRYCAQISKCLADAGIMVGGQMGPGRHDEGEYGITFYCSDFDANPRFMKLSQIFESVGLTVTRRADPNSPEQTYIFITPDED